MKHRLSVGATVGNWTLKARIPGSKHRHPHWVCVCACGTEKSIDQDNLTYGRTRSCGCLPKGDWCRTHGMSRNPIIGVWRNILNRCLKPGHASYKSYGARGITVCERWLDFQTFCADVGPHPGNGLTFDRINNEGNYEPGNVRWVGRDVQARNKRTTNLVTHEGITHCLQDWADHLGTTSHHLYRRHRKGMTWQQAIDDIRQNPPKVKGPYKLSKTKATKENQ